MRFEVENNPAIDGVTERQIRSAIAKLRSYGPSSFASITAPDGNYLQVGGGGITCTLERRDAASQRHFRAHSLQPNRIHPDGTILAFGRGQEVRLMSDEWLTTEVVADAFCCFLKREALPGILAWREITDLVS
jgi:hypothetical protein